MAYPVLKVRQWRNVIFSLQALGALESGVMLNLWGWRIVLLAYVPLIAAQLLLQFIGNRRHFALNPV